MEWWKSRSQEEKPGGNFLLFQVPKVKSLVIQLASTLPSPVSPVDFQIPQVSVCQTLLKFTPYPLCLGAHSWNIKEDTSEDPRNLYWNYGQKLYLLVLSNKPRNSTSQRTVITMLIARKFQNLNIKLLHVFQRALRTLDCVNQTFLHSQTLKSPDCNTASLCFI